jgi:arylsulfatase A-like enzyme
MEGGADPDFFNSNGPFRGYKRDLTEGGIRVPMIIRWNGTIEPGSSTDHVSAFWDILPTICDMAGISLTAETDGISFLPTLIAKENQPLHEYLYWEFYEQGGKQAVRAGKWKGIRTGVGENRNAAIMLYDLEADLGENIDLATQYPEITGRMDSIMNVAHRPSEVFTW